MKILVVGPGAVGCVLGGSLMRSGHQVVFGAKKETAERLRRGGFRIEWPSETWTFDHVEARSIEDPEEHFDHLLFCVKGYDWRAASDFIHHFPANYVLTFQNGVSIHHELAAEVSAPVLASVIYISADRTEPGVIKSKSLSRVVLDGSGNVREKMEELQKALSNSNLTALISEDIEKDLWRKYIFLCTFSALNTLTTKPLSQILAEPEAIKLWRAYMHEMITVADHCGVDFDDEEVDAVLENARRFPPNTSSSLFADTLRGQKTEIELLQGHLVKLAAERGVELPVGQTIYALLKVKTQPQ